jgi:hypothetical protein
MSRWIRRLYSRDFEELARVAQFTIAVEKTMADGVLKLMWENTRYLTAIAVKN